jgi:uncharacterized protein (DUF58 family)
MFRLSYRFYRLGTWLQHGLRRRFTPAGHLALAGLAACGALGIDMDQTVAFQGFALLMALLGVARISAAFFRGRFTVRRWLPRFATVGQPLRYLVSVRNTTPRVLEHLELLENLEDPGPSLAEYSAIQRAEFRRRRFKLTLNPSPRDRHRRALSRPAAVASLRPNAEVDVPVELLPLRRGPLRLTGLSLARPDPFGWCRGLVTVKLPETVLVLPQRYPLPPFALPGARQYQPGGVALAAAIGESEEFVSLRDYRPGDPRRHIHWRSWARLGKPIVKEFEDEFLVRHALILDTFASPDKTEAFEEAVSVAASFACTVNTQESLLDLMFVGTQAVCFTTGRGLGQAEQALEVLASVAPCAAQGFDALRALVFRHVGSVCGCIVILLDWDAPRRELVRQLRLAGLPLLVLLVAGSEEAPALRAMPPDERPADVHILEAGRVAEGLFGLGRHIESNGA